MLVKHGKEIWGKMLTHSWWAFDILSCDLTWVWHQTVPGAGWRRVEPVESWHAHHGHTPESGHWTHHRLEERKTQTYLKCFVVYWFLWFRVTNVQKLGYKVGCVMVWQFPQFSPMQSRSVGKYYRTIIERVIVITCRPPVNGVFHIIKWEWELD